MLICSKFLKLKSELWAKKHLQHIACLNTEISYKLVRKITNIKKGKSTSDTHTYTYFKYPKNMYSVTLIGEIQIKIK